MIENMIIMGSKILILMINFYFIWSMYDHSFGDIHIFFYVEPFD